MSTKMAEPDLGLALEVFRACLAGLLAGPACRGGAPRRTMADCFSLEHQTYPEGLRQGALSWPRPHRAGCRQAQEIQTHRLEMRKNQAKLRIIHQTGRRLHLDKIRPHGLEYARELPLPMAAAIVCRQW
jgi:hypothetical protein